MESLKINNDNQLYLPTTHLTHLVCKPFDYHVLCDDIAQNGYFYCKNILPHSIIDGLRNTLKTHELNHALSFASIGRGKNKILMPQIRKDKTLWINGDNPFEQEFLNFLDGVRVYFNQTLFLGLPLVESHYAIYNTGDFYARHLDSFTGAKGRIISLVIYLNKDWQSKDGGLLALYNNPQAEEPFGEIIPEYNHAVFFLSEQIPHQVTLCHKNRYSIACWFRY